jgi:hypothetical protein
MSDAIDFDTTFSTLSTLFLEESMTYGVGQFGMGFATPIYESERQGRPARRSRLGLPRGPNAYHGPNHRMKDGHARQSDWTDER